VAIIENDNPSEITQNKDTKKPNGVAWKKSI